MKIVLFTLLVACQNSDSSKIDDETESNEVKISRLRESDSDDSIKISTNDTVKSHKKVEKLLSNTEAQKIAEKKFYKYLPIILNKNGDAELDIMESYSGDFTGDGIDDVAIYFNIVPADGGNATLDQGLALYKNDGYNVDVIAGYDPPYLFSFDRIYKGHIYVTKLEYTDLDGRCCPSIKIPHVLKISGNRAY